MSTLNAAIIERAEAVADEARQQGLTGAGLKAAATDLSNKAGRVAGAAKFSPSPSSQFKNQE